MEAPMPLSRTEIEGLTEFAAKIRTNTIFCIANLGVGHIGGSLSIVDLLAYLYGHEMNVKPDDPLWGDRDQLVLSKGHAGPALYSTLSLKGFFPVSWLDTLNQGGTRLPSHCDRTRTPGIDMSTGSLGQGLSVACGMALANKLDGKTRRVFAIIGDGETQEGQNWEAAEFASQFKLSNLIAFTDYNKLQIDGTTDEIMSLGDIEARWQSFGWHTERCSGHDFEAIFEAVAGASKQTDKPSMIILDTIKGKGMKVFENQVSSHNAPVTLEMEREATGREGYYAE